MGRPDIAPISRVIGIDVENGRRLVNEDSSYSIDKSNISNRRIPESWPHIVGEEAEEEAD
jgi:hypothetical protein